MTAATYNDCVIRFANVNGSGSASANGMFAKALFRMGIPVATRNIFPSNIEGLPTWFEVRVSERGYLGRREGVDVMVAMNAETFAEDIDSIVPGGYLVYDNSKEMPPRLRRSDIRYVGVPISQLALPEFPNPKHRALFKNIIYLGAMSALISIDFEVITGMVSAQYKGKDDLIAPNIHALEIGRNYALDYLDCPLCRAGALLGRGGRPHHGGRQRRRRARRPVRRRHGVRVVSDHAVDVAGGGVREVLQPAARGRGRRAQLRHPAGGGRAGGHGHRHRRRLERRPRLHGDQRPGRVA